MRKFTSETSVKVWDDSDGHSVYIGPDADGLDCMELRQLDDGGKILARITMHEEQARLVMEGMAKLLKLREAAK